MLSIRTALAPLNVRSFRYQWGSDLLTSLAFEMETLILGWYLLVETRSVVLLGVFGALQFLGSLITPFTGVLGDRMGSRLLLLAMRMVFAVLAALIMLLSLSGALTPMVVLGMALITGLLRPTEYVMRLAMVGEIIPAGRLLGAMGLSRINIDVARIAGALTGAGLFAALGLTWSYAAVTAAYALSVIFTRCIVITPITRPRQEVRSGRAVWRELKAGFVESWRTPAVLAIMLLAFLVNLTAFPMTAGMLPYVAREVFRIDEIGLGHLTATYALGALAGSVLLSFSGPLAHANRTMLVATALWYAGLALFAFASSKALGMIVLLAIGLFQCVSMVTSLTVLLQDTGEAFRARIMGVRMLAVYGLPIGLAALGYLIQAVGYTATSLAYSLSGLAVTIAIGYRWRVSLWRS